MMCSPSELADPLESSSSVVLKSGSLSQNIGITWEIVRNANSQAHHPRHPETC